MVKQTTISSFFTSPKKPQDDSSSSATVESPCKRTTFPFPFTFPFPSSLLTSLNLFIFFLAVKKRKLGEGESSLGLFKRKKADEEADAPQTQEIPPTHSQTTTASSAVKDDRQHAKDDEVGAGEVKKTPARKVVALLDSDGEDDKPSTAKKAAV